MKVVAYLRVSTDKQAASGLSLEAQRSKAEAYCGLYDLELVAVEVDAGLSAKTLDRPALTRALDMLRTGAAGALLVVKLDRLTRSVRDLGTLVDTYFSERGGYALLSVNDSIDTRTAAGRLVLNVLASVSQWEREAIGERTSDALRAKFARGEFCGGRVRYGTKVEEGRIVLNPDERRVLVEAKRLRAAGLSLRAVAAELELAGFVNRKGRRFAAQQVRRLLAA